MIGFFQRFIKGYAKIAKPLNDLLEGEASKLKSKELELTPEALQAFEDLKKKCLTAPVLVFADFRKPFRLTPPERGWVPYSSRSPTMGTTTRWPLPVEN